MEIDVKIVNNQHQTGKQVDSKHITYMPWFSWTVEKQAELLEVWNEQESLFKGSLYNLLHVLIALYCQKKE